MSKLPKIQKPVTPKPRRKPEVIEFIEEVPAKPKKEWFRTGLLVSIAVSLWVIAGSALYYQIYKQTTINIIIPTIRAAPGSGV